MVLDDLETPALVLDKQRLVVNTAAMTQRMKYLGVGLRPHLKTAKSVEVARMALDGNFGGVTVSTLAEAVYFLDHGIRDITYAVCIVPTKLDAAAALSKRGADLKLITDNPEAARAIAEHAESHQVLVEIDCGEHRTGIAPDSNALLAIADAINRSGRSRIVGVLTHAGHSYLCRNREEMEAVADDERVAAVTAVEHLKSAGHDCSVVSVGSTPTATFAKSLAGVSEARPGVYVFMDLFQAGIGVCSRSDIALTVLASVIAHRPEVNELILDAGGLALSKDRSTQALGEDCGYGLVCDVITAEPISGLVVAGVHQEHGQVTAPSPIPFERLPVGTKVRVMPNHACMTAAAHDTYNVIDGGSDIVATWDRCHGW